MHIISSFALSILSAKTDDDFKKKDIVPAISLFFMYCAFYLDPKLEHLAFQPWWCVSLIGLRYNEILIFIGGVLPLGVPKLTQMGSNLIKSIIIN